MPVYVDVATYRNLLSLSVVVVIVKVKQSLYGLGSPDGSLSLRVPDFKTNGT